MDSVDFGLPFSMFLSCRSGKPLSRRFTKRERIAVGVMIGEPTHTLDISSEILCQTEFSGALDDFWKRINRDRKHPFVYVGSTATTLTEGVGIHFHGLTWEYVPYGILAKHARETGLGLVGEPKFIGEWKADARASAVTYRLRQTESIFGSTNHNKNKKPEKYTKTLLRPARKTLEALNPNLLSGLERAQSRSVSDEELLLSVPFFNSYIESYQEKK